MNWNDILEQTRGDVAFIFPEIMVALFGLAILLTDFLLGARQKGWSSLTAMIGVLLSAASLYVIKPAAVPPIGPARPFDGSIVIDPFFIFFGFIFLVSTALV